MDPGDVIEILRAQPFKPFRIHLSDGSAFEVRHPELAIVSFSRVILGVPGPRGLEAPVERTVMCSLSHITRIEHVEQAAKP